MGLWGIIKNSVVYPFSDWKKILILGIILSFTGISGAATPLITKNIVVINILTIVGYIIGILAAGYLFRIIKSSLEDLMELPEFKDLRGMFIDGIKVLIVGITYSIPAILIILIFIALPFTSRLGNMDSILASPVLGILLGAGGGLFVAILYMIVICPVIQIAISNMAHNENKLNSAFKLGEILDEISKIGLLEFIMWYILTGILLLVLFVIGSFIVLTVSGIVAGMFRISIPLNVGMMVVFFIELVLISLTVIPYLFMFLARSVALLFKNSKPLSEMKDSRETILAVFCTLIIIIGGIGASFGISSYQDSLIPKSTGGLFENQWIKFNYPSNLTVWDASTDEHVDISIRNGTYEIGSIKDSTSGISSVIASTETNLTTIHGREAVVGNIADSDNNNDIIKTSAAVCLTDNSFLDIKFDSDNESLDKLTFNQVINSLIVKKGNISYNISHKGSLSTYSGNGVSFNFPGKWQLSSWNDSGSLMISFADYNDNTSHFQYQINIRTGNESIQDIIKDMQRDIDPNDTIISNGTLKIGGSTAYQVTYEITPKNSYSNSHTTTIKDITFAKNGKVYNFFMEDITPDFDKEKQSFNVILNSFKVQ